MYQQCQYLQERSLFTRRYPDQLERNYKIFGTETLRAERHKYKGSRCSCFRVGRWPTKPLRGQRKHLCHPCCGLFTQFCICCQVISAFSRSVTPGSLSIRNRRRKVLWQLFPSQHASGKAAFPLSENERDLQSWGRQDIRHFYKNRYLITTSHLGQQ